MTNNSARGKCWKYINEETIIKDGCSCYLDQSSVMPKMSMP